MNLKLIAGIVFSLTVVGMNPLSAEVLNPNNPEGYQEFRMDYQEMVEIASPDRLAWRVFYDKPSTGPFNEWFDAVKQGNLAQVKEMVEKGQYIEVRDEASLGQTALGWAAFIGYEDMVDYLLEQGASVMAMDQGDVTNALKSSVLGGHVGIFKKIYEKMPQPVNVNDQQSDRQGETMLIVAASNDRQEMVEHLISLGADVNIHATTDEWWKGTPAYGQSPLSFACSNGLQEMADILIGHGAVHPVTKKASCE